VGMDHTEPLVLNVGICWKRRVTNVSHPQSQGRARSLRMRSYQKRKKGLPSVPAMPRSHKAAERLKKSEKNLKGTLVRSFYGHLIVEGKN